MFRHSTIDQLLKAVGPGALAGLVALILPGAAAAVTVLNIDFAPLLDVTPPNAGSNAYTVDYAGVGAAPDSGTVWNSLAAGNTGADGYNFEDVNIGLYDAVDGATASYSGLLDSSGAATGLGVTFDAGGSFAVSDNSGNLGNIATDAQGLMRDYLIAFGDATRSVTISGFDPNEIVTLYLYGEGDNTANNRSTLFTVDGQSAGTTGDAGAAPLTEGADFVRLAGVTADGAGDLTIAYGVNGSPEGPFNGLQVLYDLDVGIPGDTDGDNDVDLDDYENIRSNFRASGAVTRLDGDIAGPNNNLVGDGVVDFYDFVAWQENFPTSPGSLAESHATPEPAALLLSATLLLAAGPRRRG